METSVDTVLISVRKNPLSLDSMRVINYTITKKQKTKTKTINKKIPKTNKKRKQWQQIAFSVISNNTGLKT